MSTHPNKESKKHEASESDAFEKKEEMSGDDDMPVHTHNAGKNQHHHSSSFHERKGSHNFIKVE